MVVWKSLRCAVGRGREQSHRGKQQRGFPSEPTCPEVPVSCGLRPEVLHI